MATFVAAFLVFLGVVAGMAIGVIFGRRAIRGSCGGLSAWRDELGRPMCEACAECPEKRDECELETKERPGNSRRRRHAHCDEHHHHHDHHGHHEPRLTPIELIGAIENGERAQKS